MDVTSPSESTVAYFWRELKNPRYSSLDSHTYSLKLNVLNPGTEGALSEGKLPLDNSGLVLVFPSKTNVFFQLKLCGNALLPLVGSSALSSQKCQCHAAPGGFSSLFCLHLQSFSCVLLWSSLLCFGEVLWLGERASRAWGGFCAWALFNSQGLWENQNTGWIFNIPCKADFWRSVRNRSKQEHNKNTCDVQCFVFFEVLLIEMEWFS